MAVTLNTKDCGPKDCEIVNGNFKCDLNKTLKFKNISQKYDVAWKGNNT